MQSIDIETGHTGLYAEYRQKPNIPAYMRDIDIETEHTGLYAEDGGTH